jgi:hypothetical protein
MFTVLIKDPLIQNCLFLVPKPFFLLFLKMLFLKGIIYLQFDENQGDQLIL